MRKHHPKPRDLLTWMECGRQDDAFDAALTPDGIEQAIRASKHGIAGTRAPMCLHRNSVNMVPLAQQDWSWSSHHLFHAPSTLPISSFHLPGCRPCCVCCAFAGNAAVEATLWRIVNS
jgi:hypothetical protein